MWKTNPWNEEGAGMSRPTAKRGFMWQGKNKKNVGWSSFLHPFITILTSSVKDIRQRQCECHGLDIYRDLLQLQQLELWLPSSTRLVVNLGGTCCMWGQIPISAHPVERGFELGTKRKRWGNHLYLQFSQSIKAMSMIQEELVREAILAVRFPLVEKHRKGEKIKAATVQSEWAATNSASVSTEEKTISTLATHCNSLVSRKGVCFTLLKLVAVLQCKTM